MGQKVIKKRKTKRKIETKKPKLYKVLMHNDNYTTMEFVVAVLQTVFNKSQEDAVRIMLHIHNHGIGECGIYTYDIATSKVELTHFLARKNDFPLKCTIEPVEEWFIILTYLC